MSAYTTADIIKMHMYHCIDCLVEGYEPDCGCADAARDELRTDLRGEEPDSVWAAHVAWAIKEYADDRS